MQLGVCKLVCQGHNNLWSIPYKYHGTRWMWHQWCHVVLVFVDCSALFWMSNSVTLVYPIHDARCKEAEPPFFMRVDICTTLNEQVYNIDMPYHCNCLCQSLLQLLGNADWYALKYGVIAYASFNYSRTHYGIQQAKRGLRLETFLWTKWLSLLGHFSSHDMLAAQSPKLRNVVKSTVIQAFCRMTNTCYCHEPVPRSMMDHRESRKHKELCSQT